MPDIDLERVAAIKQALQRGEISTDPAELAGSMEMLVQQFWTRRRG